MTGRTETHVLRAVPDAPRPGASRKAGGGPMSDRGMAAVELGVSMVALAAVILLAVGRG